MESHHSGRQHGDLTRGRSEATDGKPVVAGKISWTAPPAAWRRSSSCINASVLAGPLHPRWEPTPKSESDPCRQPALIGSAEGSIVHRPCRIGDPTLGQRQPRGIIYVLCMQHAGSLWIEILQATRISRHFSATHSLNSYVYTCLLLVANPHVVATRAAHSSHRAVPRT